MAKKLEYQIGVDASQGVKGVKDFSRTVQSELKNVEGDFADTATAGERVATVLSRMAGELDTELARAAQAADALKAALGEDLGGRADVGQLVGDLQRMGLTFEEITADADKLAGAMKELDSVQVKGLDSGLGGVNTKLGDLEKSAGGSRSVLANMVGNSVQDLGALGGLAGSAGVAIGQMGEYMADAAGEGDKLGAILKNFGGVAVPLAAIGLATSQIASHFQGIKKAQENNTKQAEEFADALAEGATAAEAVETALTNAGKIEFTTKGGDVFDVTDRLAELGLTVEQFSVLVAGGTPAINKWGDAMKAAGADGDAVTEVMVAAGTQSQNLADAQRLSAINAKVFGTENKKSAKSTEEATRASKDYAAQLGIAQGRVGAFAQVQADNLDQMVEWADAVTEGIEGAKAYSDAVAGIDYKTASINGAVTAMGKFNKKAFDLANIAQDIHESFGTLGETLFKETEDGRKRIELTGDVATEAGRKQQDAIEGVAQALELQFAAAYDKAGGSLKKFRDNASVIGDATLGQLRDELGLTDDEVALLRDQLNLTAGDYEARFKMSGTEEAITQIGLLQGAIDKLPEDKEIKVEQKILAGDYKGALKVVQDYYDQNPAEITVKPVIKFGGYSYITGGGATGTVGTLAAPAGTRMLGAAPTASLPPITVPVTAAPTAGPGRSQVVNQHLTINTAVMGDPFAVTAVVDEAMRRGARLLPKTP